MEWVGNNLIALIALALSGWSVWRTRHRVMVSCRSASETTGGTDGSVAHSWVLLTVTTIGRRTSVEDVLFENVPNVVGPGISITWGPPLTALNALNERLETLYGKSFGFGTTSRLLEDGESVSWPYRVGESIDRLGPPVKQYRAAVKLANGKTIRSEPFEHAQSPHQGWVFDSEGRPPIAS